MPPPHPSTWNTIQISCRFMSLPHKYLINAVKLRQNCPNNNQKLSERWKLRQTLEYRIAELFTCGRCWSTMSSNIGWFNPSWNLLLLFFFLVRNTLFCTPICVSRASRVSYYANYTNRKSGWNHDGAPCFSTIDVVLMDFLTNATGGRAK